MSLVTQCIIPVTAGSSCVVAGEVTDEDGVAGSTTNSCLIPGATTNTCDPASALKTISWFGNLNADFLYLQAEHQNVFPSWLIARTYLSLQSNTKGYSFPTGTNFVGGQNSEILNIVLSGNTLVVSAQSVVTLASDTDLFAAYPNAVAIICPRISPVRGTPERITFNLPRMAALGIDRFSLLCSALWNTNFTLPPSGGVYPFSYTTHLFSGGQVLFTLAGSGTGTPTITGLKLFERRLHTDFPILGSTLPPNRNYWHRLNISLVQKTMELVPIIPTTQVFPLPPQ